LIHYYDPLYEKGLAKREKFITGEGGESDLIAAFKGLINYH
jgi:hypothetical protein